MNFFKFFIHSNIYIALGAVALTVESQALLGLELEWHPYLFILFFAVLVDYNFHRLITVLTNAEALDAPKHAWVKGNKKMFFAIVGFSIVGFLIAVSQAKLDVLLALLPVALITLFYSIPFAKFNSGTMRLRDIPGIKIFLISFVWSYVTVGLPVFHAVKHFPLSTIFLLIFERFLFAFAITLPFDIRDMEADRASGLKTIPLVIGAKKTLKLAEILLLLFCVLTAIHFGVQSQWYFSLALLISGLSSWYLLKSDWSEKSPFYYFTLLDATILFQGVLVVLGSLLK